MAVQGLFGSGSYVADERPKDWKEGISYLYPNGMAPLTALLSKLANERTTDPEFYWWTQAWTSQRIVGTMVTAANGSTGATGATVAPAANGLTATTYFFKPTALADMTQLRVGHQILVRKAGTGRFGADYTADALGKVIAVDTSTVQVKFYKQQADLSLVDCCIIAGNVNSEGASMPTSVSYNPTKYYNKTQIWRTPLNITRTARQTTVRTKDKYARMKKEALDLHSQEMERALWYGIQSEIIGSNGMPERTTDGIFQMISNLAPANIDSYKSTTEVAASTSWVNGGEIWIDTILEKIFRTGDQERIGFCGNGVLLAIQTLLKNKAQYKFEVTAGRYGMKATIWETPFGTLYLKTHPLFTQDPNEFNTLAVIDPSDLKYRFIQDTKFYGMNDSQTTSQGRVDGTTEEFLTEAGLEVHFPQKFGLFRDFGAAHN